MEIEFVNHASVLLKRGSVRLLCDPWLDGAIFNDSWALLSPSNFSPDRFEEVTHLWFSHEHPDHFNTATLVAIPESARAHIQVLVRAFPDRKIARFCERVGFGSVVELAHGAVHELEEGFRVRCFAWPSYDSWLYVDTPEATLLNVNDCHITTQEQVEAARAELDAPVDLLLTQFAISAWHGNPDETGRLHQGAEDTLVRTTTQTAGFGARWVLPFASYIWFCHEENTYMNTEIPPVDEVDARLRRDTEAEPVVLYPGDSWEVGSPLDTRAALRLYRADWDSIPQREAIAAPAVEEDDLFRASAAFCAKLREGVHPLKWRLRMAKMAAEHEARRSGKTGLAAKLSAALGLATLRVRPVRIWLRDLDGCYAFDLVGGLRHGPWPREGCDIELGADGLYYALNFLWGGDTLMVSGRFRNIRPDGHKELFAYFSIATWLNRNAGATQGPLSKG